MWIARRIPNPGDCSKPLPNVLYALLKKEGHNAYGRSHSLIRELVSFGRALTHKTQAA